MKNTDSRPEPPLTDPRSFEAQAIDSSRLFGGRTEVEIRHNGRTYRLRRTRLGKLILTA